MSSYKENVQEKKEWQGILGDDRNRHKFITHDYDTEKLFVTPMGDEHIGSKHYDEDEHKKNVEWNYENDYPLILMGDTLETSTRDSVGAGIFEQDEIVQEQLEKAVKIYKPLAEKGLILGNHIGNHESVSKDTDILTKEGWKNVEDVTKEDYIGQFYVKTNEVKFFKPKKLIKHFAKELIVFESNNSKQKVTKNHELVVEGEKVIAKNIKKLRQKQLFCSGKYNQKGIEITNEDISLLTWVIMDGTIVDYKKYNPKSKKVRIQFKLSYKRKINQLKKLLNSLDIPFTFKEATMSGINKLQPYYIRIYGDEARRINHLLNGKKQIPQDWINMNKEQVKVFLSTLEETDASKTNRHLSWVTINKDNVDIIQQACLLNNINFYYVEYENSSGFENGKKQYICRIFEEKLYDCEVKISKEDYNDYVYCFENILGTLITRVDGKPSFTGNCRVFNHSGANLSKILAQMLDIDYLGVGAVHYFRVGESRYTLYSTHGKSGSRLPHTKIKAVLDLANMIDTDIYCMGHLHSLDHHVRNFYRPNKKNKTIDETKKHFILTGSYLTHWNSYAHISGLEPSRKGSPRIRLNGLEKEVFVSL